jgi:hypothetical protein
VVVEVGNKHVAVAVDREVARGVELRRGSRSVAKAFNTRARERRDVVGRRVEAANAVVAGVGNEHVAVAVHCETARAVELRRARRPVLKACSNRASERCDASRCRVVPAEAVVVPLGENHRPVGECGDVPRRDQFGCGCCPIAEPPSPTPHDGRHCWGPTCARMQTRIHGDAVGEICGCASVGVGGWGGGERDEYDSRFRARFALQGLLV